MAPKRKQPPFPPPTFHRGELFDPFELYYLSTNNVDNNEQVHKDIQQWLNDNKDNTRGLKAAVAYLDEDNVTPLHEICKRDPPLDVIVTFITHAPEVLQIKDRYGSLPIRHACAYGASLDVIKALVTGYPESLAHEGPIGGDLPLNYAIYNRASAEVLSFLMESYPAVIDQEDNTGRTSLDHLIEKEYAIKIDADGMYLLHHACKNLYSVHLVRLLILANSESCMKKDNNGFIPLHHACANNDGSNMESIKILLDAFPDSTTGKDNNDKTPSQHLKPRASERDDRGQFMLHRLASRFAGLAENTLRLLLDANFEAISSPDIYGMLPFHHACLNKESSLEVLISLVKLYPESLAV